MSWLLKTLQSNPPDQSNSPETPSSNLGGVKDDLSVIGESIGRQLRGVATFLAPPPTAASSAADVASFEDDSSSQTMIGIRNDLVEIGGRFKSGLSLLSSNKAVSGFSKFASSLLQLEEKEIGDGDDIPGITDEVVNFVKEISLRPEIWTEFPVSLNADFDMSDAQREHASTIEQFAPSLSDLLNKLQSQMSDERFWMIYFILLLPRLNKYDFELLSTPKIVEARDILLQKLQKRRNSVEEFELDTFQDGSKLNKSHEGHQPSPEKEVLAERVTSSETVVIDERNSDTITSSDAHKMFEREEEVSFSDLEDDGTDLDSRPSSSKLAHDTRASSPTGSSDWVQLNQSETQGGWKKSGPSTSREKDSEGESSDWLNVDDFD